MVCYYCFYCCISRIKRNIFGYTVWHNGFRVELRLHIVMQIWMNQVTLKKKNKITHLFYLCSDECGKYSFSSLPSNSMIYHAIPHNAMPYYSVNLKYGICKIFCIFYKLTRNGASSIQCNFNIDTLQYSYYSVGRSDYRDRYGIIFVL